VWIDPDGFLDHDWMAVIVRAETGVSYRQQCGGTACRQGTVEGYLVPVFSRAAYAALTGLFEGTLQGAGAWNWRWPDELLTVLREAVALVRMPPSAWSDFPDESQPLLLDESRLDEADEAWIPVTCADGPGVLTWPNSD
jgi:hypothetical protein